MKRRRVLVFPLLFALLLALAASGCSAAPHASGGVLRIGVREDIPDFDVQEWFVQLVSRLKKSGF